MQLVSVIIPVLNGEAALGEALSSVLAQTHQELEILVIDDGSTDGTVEVARSIGDARISVHSFDNGGISTARNRGIALANGEYLSFLDHDDLWTTDKLQKQVEALEANPRAGVAYSFTYHTDYEGNVVHGGFQEIVDGDVLEALFVRFLLQCGSNGLVRRRDCEAVGGFNESLFLSEDYDFFLRLAERCDFALVPEHQIYYRGRPESASNLHFVELRRDTHRIIAAAAARQPARLKPLQWHACAVIDGYVVGKILKQPFRWSHAWLALRCLATHLRAGPFGWGLLFERRDKVFYWTAKIAAWTLVPGRLRPWLSRRWWALMGHPPPADDPPTP